MRSYFNAKKYLKSDGTNDGEHPKYYAVIFGSAPIPGRGFAHYLAEKGFNLILIERSIDPLNSLELSIRKNNNSIIIHKVVLDKFD